jgi:hypothetical protein
LAARLEEVRRGPRSSRTRPQSAAGRGFFLKRINSEPSPYSGNRDCLSLPSMRGLELADSEVPALADRRWSGFVRRLLRYYGGIRLLTPVHHRLRLLAFPTRTRRHKPAGQTRDLPVPVQGPSAHARVSDHAGPSGRSRWRARSCCLPRFETRRRPIHEVFRGSMAGLCSPLSTLRPNPREL